MGTFGAFGFVSAVAHDSDVSWGVAEAVHVALWGRASGATSNSYTSRSCKLKKNQCDANAFCILIFHKRKYVRQMAEYH